MFNEGLVADIMQQELQNLAFGGLKVNVWDVCSFSLYVLLVVFQSFIAGRLTKLSNSRVNPVTASLEFLN
jgi:hypothetical protein